MDVPSSAAGRLDALAVEKGDRVSKGEAIVDLESADSDAAKPAAPERSRRRKACRTPRPSDGSFRYRSARSRSRRLQGCRGHRRAREAGRHRGARDTAHHAGDRQGDDGRSVSAAGRVLEVHAAKGARVNAGDLVATVGGRGRPGRARGRRPRRRRPHPARTVRRRHRRAAPAPRQRPDVAGPRRPVGAPPCARARRRPREGHGQRHQGPDHARRRESVRQESAGGPPRGGSWGRCRACTTSISRRLGRSR